MRLQETGPEPTARRTWQANPPLFARRTQVGRSGDFYTSVTLSVPQKTAIRHVSGIRLGLSNGRDGCFTTFHSLQEFKAFADWLHAHASSDELESAFALSKSQEVVLTNLSEA